MQAYEFKLALMYRSILETEVSKNGCELKLDCFTYGIEILPDLGCFKLICCYNVHFCQFFY